jgi:hypothetical protein
VDLQATLAFRPDQFQLNFSQIVSDCRDDFWLPGHRGLLFAPQCWLGDSRYAVIDLDQEREVDRESLRFLPSPLWQQQGFGLASYPWNVDAEQVRPGQLLTSFRSAVVRQQLRALHLAVEWCHKFLSSRMVGDQRLGQHPVVVQGLGRVIRDLYALRTVDLAGVLADRSWFIDEVDNVAEQLIKLVGGRAMLSGQMVQLRTMLLTLNRLYLEDPACTS